MDELAFSGAAALAGMIRRREVASRELTELYLRRIERYDGDLNAYRVTFPERALVEAGQADGRAGAGDTRPLLGVPIAIKDDIDVAGAETALGGDAHGGPVAADAEVVRRLRAAGAVILGKTSVPELTITPWTESPTFGVTRNPWDRLRTPGGSSGGSAAAVAGGLCAVAIGSDGAGSIRIPAGCCGLFGMKAQNGTVPTAPLVEPWHGMTLWGPLSRRVADSALVYDVIKDGGPSFAAAAGGDPGRVRVAMSVRTPPLTGLQADAEQLGAVEAVAQALRELGHEVVEREVEYTPALSSNVLARYLGGIAAMGRSVPHPERLSRRTRGYMRIGGAVPGAAIRRAKAAAAAEGEALWRGVDADLLLTPMFTRRPPRVREYDGTSALRSLSGSVRLVPYCGPYNHTGQPAASVPAGFTSDGFPLAVQLVAPAHGEPALLQVATQLEAALGWPDRTPAL